VQVTPESTANCHNSLLSILKSHEDSEEDLKKEEEEDEEGGGDDDDYDDDDDDDDQSLRLEKANVKPADKVFRFCECNWNH